MSKESKILGRLTQQSNLSTDIAVVQHSELWPRFAKVKGAVTMSLLSRENVGIKRYLNTVNWEGYDTGIHDHSGHVEGVINGVQINFEIKGTTLDNKQEVVTDEKGEWHLQTSKGHNFEIKGDYVSTDGRKGKIRVLIDDGKWTEAYWLQVQDGSFRLEQVVSPSGRVFETAGLDPDRDGYIQTPETNY